MNKKQIDEWLNATKTEKDLEYEQAEKEVDSLGDLEDVDEQEDL
jgi:hypothetical protein